MNPRQVVKISNILGIISVLLLVYWVFTFITIQVFDLKVFRRGISELFAISILAILAVIFSSLVINIMFNLTRIAQKHNLDAENKGINRKVVFSFIALFPLILAILFGGHYYTMKKKEQLLIASANSIVSMYSQQNNFLLDYSFTPEYINSARDILTLYKKTDNNLNYVEVIVLDTLQGKDPIYLHFGNRGYRDDGKTELNKIDYIRNTSHEEREYLNKVFNEDYDQVRYSAHRNKVELFFPYSHNGKKIVFYFSDYQRYGKLGSSL